MPVITLKHGTHSFEVLTNNLGFITKTVHTWPDGVAIDDVWTRRGLSCTPDSVVQAHINSGWTLEG